MVATRLTRDSGLVQFSGNGLHFRERCRAPDAQLALTDGDQRVAVGQERNCVDRSLVSFEGRHFLPRIQVPNRDKSIKGADSQAPSVCRDGTALEKDRTRVERKKLPLRV